MVPFSTCTQLLLYTCSCQRRQHSAASIPGIDALVLPLQPTLVLLIYCDGCVDAIALLLVRCKRSSLMLLRRLPPLLTLRDRSRPPLLCRLPLLYTHSVSAAIGATCAVQARKSAQRSRHRLQCTCSLARETV